MPKTITTTVYSYDELEDDAKKTAFKSYQNFLISDALANPELDNLGRTFDNFETAMNSNSKGNHVHYEFDAWHGQANVELTTAPITDDPLYLREAEPELNWNYITEDEVTEDDSAIAEDICNAWNKCVIEADNQTQRLHDKWEDCEKDETGDITDEDDYLDFRNDYERTCERLINKATDAMNTTLNKCIKEYNDWLSSEEYTLEYIEANQPWFTESGLIYES